MKMIWCGLKIKETYHVLANQFHGIFHSKTLVFWKIRYVFRNVKWCFNASWGLKGLTIPITTSHVNCVSLPHWSVLTSPSSLQQVLVPKVEDLLEGWWTSQACMVIYVNVTLLPPLNILRQYDIPDGKRPTSASLLLYLWVDPLHCNSGSPQPFHTCSEEKGSTNVGSMLARRLRRRANIEPALESEFQFGGKNVNLRTCPSQHQSTFGQLWGRPGGGAPNAQGTKKINLDSVLNEPKEVRTQLNSLDIYYYHSKTCFTLL